MSAAGGREHSACEEARMSIHERLDGPVSADEARRLEQHLERCELCREYEQGLGAVQRVLRELPEHRFPDDALEEVWDRTVRAEPDRAWTWAAGWRTLAAAAVLAAALLGLWSFTRVGDGTAPGGVAMRTEQPAPEEVTRAAEEARLVLGLTLAALRRAERATAEEVFAGEISPALQRLPIQFSTDKRRSGT